MNSRIRNLNRRRNSSRPRTKELTQRKHQFETLETRKLLTVIGGITSETADLDTITACKAELPVSSQRPTVTSRVTSACQNQAPIAVDDSYTVDHDGTLLIDPLAKTHQAFHDDPDWTITGADGPGNDFKHHADGKIGPISEPIKCAHVG